MKIVRTMEGAETWDANLNVTEYEIKYFVLAPTSKDAALRTCFNQSPAKKGNLFRTKVRSEGYDKDGNLEVTVVYSANDNSSSSSNSTVDAEPTISFSCGGGSKHMTTAIQQTVISGASAGGAIGWNGKSGSDCEIAGVDVPTAELTKTYTKVMRIRDITTNFERNVANMVGTVNSREFKGWKKGEVMFREMSYSAQKNDTKVVVSFSFAIHPNESGVKIPGTTHSFSKEGWQYVWMIPETEIDANGEPRVNVKGLYLATVCRYEDFNKLGI